MSTTTSPTTPVINQQTVSECTALSDLCPVDQTIYGYYPDLGGNAFFLAFFILTMLISIGQGIKYKTWTYMIALAVGSLTEAIGFVGRVLMNDNPWSPAGFNMQICCLIIAPAFISAGLYLTLKHIVIECGAESSRIPARYYTWIFIGCDLLSLVLQGAGGGLAAGSDPGSSGQDLGTNLMIAGIVWQVVTLLAFGALVTDYVLRSRKSVRSASASSLIASTRFKLFTAGLAIAFITIFTRCVFRIAELGPGWRNKIMQNEPEFLVLDSGMVAIATLFLVAFHPGYIFPEMQMHKNNLPAGVNNVEKSASQSDIEASPMGETGTRQGYFGSKFNKGRLGRK